jgi:uncharacterized membrane protein YkoI
MITLMPSLQFRQAALLKGIDMTTTTTTTKTTIKGKTAVVSAALAVLLVSAGAFAAEPSQDTLRAQAKVTQAQATATALAVVPGGKVESAELEREHGKLVWSFDLIQPRVKGVTEIQVDAVSGTVVSQKRESPAQQADEAKAEAREAGGAK